MISSDDVTWAFRMLLGRDPESQAAVEHHLRHASPPTRDGLRAMLIGSAEFAGSLARFGVRLVNEQEEDDRIGPFLELSDAPGEPGLFRDRFGVRTRCNYLPTSYDIYSGKAAVTADDIGMPLHDPAELSGLLRSIEEAKTRFTVMELGAGWGPWLVLGAKFAARRGLPCRLIGVEASRDHLDFMRTHFQDNALAPDDHVLIHAAVGPETGVASFPKLPEARADWGAQARFAETAIEGNGADEETVPCVSVSKLLEQHGDVDFLHCDIQGAEYEALAPAIDRLTKRVRRIVVGTHGRRIESDLLDLFSRNGWELEYDQACVMNQRQTKMDLSADGVQAWRNTHMMQRSD